MPRQRVGEAAETIERFLGEPIWDFVAKGSGVGAAGTVLEYVKKYTPLTGVSDEIMQGLAGLGLVNYGDRVHTQVPNIGRGVLYELFGRAVYKERIAPMIPVIGVVGSAGSDNTGHNQGTSEDYVAQKYGL